MLSPELLDAAAVLEELLEARGELMFAGRLWPVVIPSAYSPYSPNV